jgi:hypothetical protein
MLRASLTLMSMVAFCACASAKKSPRTVAAADYKAKDGTATASAGQAKPGGKIVCEEELPLGSHIPERVCRYQEDMDANRQETQDVLHANPAKNTRPGG